MGLNLAHDDGAASAGAAMKRTIKVYPVGGEQPANWLEWWNTTRPDASLTLVAEAEHCQAYLACDLATNVIAAAIKDLPNRPVIWPPMVYDSCGHFGADRTAPYEAFLRKLYGEVSRAELVQTLHSAKRALDDASGVVDAGEGEDYAYEHELRRLEQLIEQLESGAYIVDKEVNHARCG